MFQQLPAFLRISLNMAVVIGALMAVTPFLKKRYHARWRTLAWLIIALRLLIPFHIPVIQLQIPVPERL